MEREEIDWALQSIGLKLTSDDGPALEVYRARLPYRVRLHANMICEADKSVREGWSVKGLNAIRLHMLSQLEGPQAPDILLSYIKLISRYVLTAPEHMQLILQMNFALKQKTYLRSLSFQRDMRFADMRRYIEYFVGRVIPIEHLDPDTVETFQLICEELDDVVKVANTISTLPVLLIYDSEEVGAFARDFEEFDLIGISGVALLQPFIWTNHILSDPEGWTFADEVGIAEVAPERELLMNGFEILSRPLGSKREELANELANFVISYFFLHELGHIIKGNHRDSRSSSDGNYSEEGDEVQKKLRLLQFSYELDADIFALLTMLTLSSTTRINRIFPDSSYIHEQLKEADEHVYLNIYACLLTAALTQEQWNDHNGDHPSGAVRIMAMLEAARRVLKEAYGLSDEDAPRVVMVIWMHLEDDLNRALRRPAQKSYFGSLGLPEDFEEVQHFFESIRELAVKDFAERQKS